MTKRDTFFILGFIFILCIYVGYVTTMQDASLAHAKVTPKPIKVSYSIQSNEGAYA